MPSSKNVLPRRPRQGFRLAALAAALLVPAQAPAFFQQTSLEGVVGQDIGGAWLAVHHLMPEFRVSFAKPEKGPALPFEVSEIPPSLLHLVGKGGGVALSACGNGAFCNENGLQVGDVIVRVAASEIHDVASFRKATDNLPQSVLMFVRRPSLAFSTARLFKMKYSAAPAGEGQSALGEEKLDVKMLDVQLPFRDAVEKTRQTHEAFRPSADDLKKLGEGWETLPASQPPMIMNSKNRFVARADFDESMAADTLLVNSSHAMLLDMQGNAAKGVAGKSIDLYGIETMTPKSMEGGFVTVSIANAPFPINIEFKGRFQMTRVADWSDKDEKFRAEEAAKRQPKEDLSKYKTLPDVPAPAAPAKGK